MQRSAESAEECRGMICVVTVEISMHEEPPLQQIIPGQAIKSDPAAGELHYPGYRRQPIEVVIVNGSGEVFGPGGNIVTFPASTRSQKEFDLINPHHYIAWLNGLPVASALLNRGVLEPFRIWGG